MWYPFLIEIDSKLVIIFLSFLDFSYLRLSLFNPSIPLYRPHVFMKYIYDFLLV